MPVHPRSLLSSRADRAAGCTRDDPQVPRAGGRLNDTAIAGRELAAKLGKFRGMPSSVMLRDRLRARSEFRQGALALRAPGAGYFTCATSPVSIASRMFRAKSDSRSFFWTV